MQGLFLLSLTIETAASVHIQASAAGLPVRRKIELAQKEVIDHGSNPFFIYGMSCFA